MSEKKAKASNLFNTNSSDKSGSSHSRKESDDESAEMVVSEIKRRSSIPKLFGSVSRRKLSDAKPLLKEDDLSALLEASSTKQSKKLKLAEAYAPKKQVCELQVQLLKAITEANDRIDQLQKDNSSLTFRISNLEKECFTLQSIQNSQRAVQFVNLPVSENDSHDTPTCFSTWFL